MKTKVLVGLLLFLIVINLATLGTWLYLRFAAPPDMPPMMAGGPPAVMRDLSPETRDKIRTVMMTFRREVMPLQRAVRAAEDSVAALLLEESVPTEIVHRTLQRVADLRAAISMRAVDHLITTKAFLTPEQQHEFFRAIIEAQPRMRGEGMMGRGMGMGPGGPPDGAFGRDERMDTIEHRHR